MTYKERYSYIGQTGYFIYCRRKKWRNNGYWNHFCDTNRNLLMCARLIKNGLYEAELYVREKPITTAYVAHIGNTVFLTQAEAENKIKDITL